MPTGVYPSEKRNRMVTWGQKISEGRKGIKFSDEHRKNISKRGINNKKKRG